MALYYPLSASLVLFTNILSYPQAQHAASDIHLMNLITSFITHSVQPGTSFAATPTLSMFKELYSIATRLVAGVRPHNTQEMKRPAENNGTGRSDSISSSIVRVLPDASLWSDLNTQTTALFVSSRFRQQSL
jgi:hypothetical protein